MIDSVLHGNHSFVVTRSHTEELYFDMTDVPYVGGLGTGLAVFATVHVDRDCMGVTFTQLTQGHPCMDCQFCRFSPQVLFIYLLTYCFILTS